MWQPKTAYVEQIQQVLAGCLSPDSTIRTPAYEMLDEVKSQLADFENYLTILLIQDGDSTVRALAGTTLKNSLKSATDLDFIRTHIVTGLSTHVPLVANITGIVITELFKKGGVKSWPEVIPQLLAMSLDGNVGALKALSKVCEDSARLLDTEIHGQRPLDVLVPQFLVLMESRDAKIRALAIKCANSVIPLQTQSFIVYMDAFLGKCFALATDSDADVVKNICDAFSGILVVRPDKIFPNLEGIVNYTVHIVQSAQGDESLALAACQFLLELADSSIPSELVSPYLGKIIPALLQSMVYNEEGILQKEGEQDDADVEDKDEDIKPMFSKISKANDKKDDAEDEDDDTEWNLRKCAASSLDILSNKLPGEVVAVALPVLQGSIASDQWPIREASILAFGAVAVGALDQLRSTLKDLVQFLVQSLGDACPAVREISCWTLSRYAEWIVNKSLSFFMPCMESLMQLMGDRSKSVQRAACSALSAFLEVADEDLVGGSVYTALVARFAECFNFYKKKNMIVLYDAMQTFAERQELDDDAVQLMAVNLVNRWYALADSDKECWALLECLSAVAASLGPRFAPYAEATFNKAFAILSHCVALEQRAAADPHVETLEKDYLITSLDLIDGIIQALGQESAVLVTPPLVAAMVHCFGDEHHEVRQSAYALLGDLGIFVPGSIVSSMGEICAHVRNEIVNYDYDASLATNNAVWSLGEVSLRVDLSQYIVELSTALMDMINTKGVQTMVCENVAIAIGRLSLKNPEAFAPQLGSFISQWLAYTAFLKDDEETRSALAGFLNLCQMNPDALVLRSKLAVIDMITNYEGPSEELAMINYQILQCFNGEAQQIYGNITNEQKGYLSTVYNWPS